MENEWEWKSIVVSGVTVAQGWQCPICNTICAEKRCPKNHKEKTNGNDL